ncbi:MAG: DUF721 domain-containing protein [Candidatus Neomarinimicrobiota bacterium]
MTQSLKNIINSFLRSTGLEKGVAQQKALFIWSDVVGKAVGKNTQPESVEHGIITVHTTTPAWRQELQFKKSDIIEKLNEKLGKKIIKDIRFI